MKYDAMQKLECIVIYILFFSLSLMVVYLICKINFIFCMFGFVLFIYFFSFLYYITTFSISVLSLPDIITTYIHNGDSSKLSARPHDTCM